MVDVDFNPSVKNCGPSANSILALDNFAITVKIGTFAKIANRSAKTEALYSLPRSFKGQFFKLLKISAITITGPPSSKYFKSSYNSDKPAPSL